MRFGMWLNLAEYLIWVQEVVGSNPVVPVCVVAELDARMVKRREYG